MYYNMAILAKINMKGIVTLLGVPSSILLERGYKFTSNF